MDVALVAALAPAAGRRLSTREIADLACRLEGQEAGIPGGRQDQFAAAFGGFLRLSLPRPRRDGRAARAGPGVRRGAGAADAALLHRRLALLRHHHRAGHAGVRARRSRDRRRAGRDPRGRGGDGRGARGRRFRRDRRAAERELAAAAAARRRHVHAGDGAARGGDERCRVSRRQGGGLGRRRLDVLPGPRRSHARARGRGASWACGCSRSAGRRRACARAEADRAGRSGARRCVAPPISRRCWSGSPSGSSRCSDGRPSRPRARRCSPRTAGSVPTDGSPLRVRSLESPRRIAARRAANEFTGERHDRRLGPLAAPLAGASGPPSSRRWALSVSERTRPGPRRRILTAYAERYPDYPQPRQRARAQPAVLLHLSRVHLAHQLPRGRVAAAGGRAARAVGRGGRERASPTRPPT